MNHHSARSRNGRSTSTGRFIAGSLLFATIAGASTLALAERLATGYEKDRAFTVSLSSETASETTRNEILMDGEPIDRGGRGFGGGERTSTFEVEYTDTIMAAADGAPSRVKRTFDAVSGATEMEGRDGPVERSMESSFEGLTMILTRADDDTVEIEIEDGDAPDQERLEGHALELPLDGLLPEDEVEAGSEWEIDGEAFMDALGMGMQRKLVDRPERGGGERGERGGRGGRGGRRGGQRGGGNGAAMLAGGDWNITATLTDETKDVDGIECMVIKIEAEVDGSPESPEREGVSVDASFSGNFEGELLWCKSESRPVELSVEGTYELSTEMTRDSERGVFEMSRAEETTVEITVSVAASEGGE
ncbi:MAG: hypothetical protein AAGG01_02885 [Planctomycetota bacterium]